MVQPGSGSLAETNPLLIALQMHTDLLSLQTTRENIDCIYYSIAPPSFCPSPLLPTRCYSCTSIRKVNSQNQMVVCTGGMHAVENGAICCDLSRVLFLSPQPQLSIHSHSAALPPLLLFFFGFGFLNSIQSAAATTRIIISNEGELQKRRSVYHSHLSLPPQHFHCIDSHSSLP